MIYVFIYLVAIVMANLLVATFGPPISIINSFIFIGLDLSIRDNLHEIWKTNRFFKMFLLIFSGGIISFILNFSAGRIAIASTIAFLSAGLVDYFVYTYLHKFHYLVKSNGSNLFGSIVDSLVFPIIAFGFPLAIIISIGQFIAKFLGGFFWSLILNITRKVDI